MPSSQRDVPEDATHLPMSALLSSLHLSVVDIFLFASCVVVVVVVIAVFQPHIYHIKAGTQVDPIT